MRFAIPFCVGAGGGGGGVGGAGGGVGGQAGVLVELVAGLEVGGQALAAVLVADDTGAVAVFVGAADRQGPVLVGAAVVIPLDDRGAGARRAALHLERERAVVRDELGVAVGVGGGRQRAGRDG